MLIHDGDACTWASTWNAYSQATTDLPLASSTFWLLRDGVRKKRTKLSLNYIKATCAMHMMNFH